MSFEADAALPAIARHPLVERLAALLERGSSLDLRVASLKKAASLVCRDATDVSPPPPARRNKDDIAKSLASTAAVHLLRSMPTSSQSAVLTRSRLGAAAATPVASTYDPKTTDLDADVASVSSDSPSAASSATSDCSAESPRRSDAQIAAAPHVNFLVNQMRSALTAQSHLAPPLQSAEFREMGKWLKGDGEKHGGGEGACPHETRTMRAQDDDAGVPEIMRGEDPMLAARAHESPTAAAPAALVAPPPSTANPPASPPNPAPSEAPSSANTTRDWASEAAAAIAAGVWKQATDKQQRTYFFHVREKKTCWNLAKELEKRATAS